MVTEKAIYLARNRDTARKHGKRVLAAPISNHEFQHQFHLEVNCSTKDPSGSLEHIRTGYWVVRKLGTADEYVTWMPANVFEGRYRLEQDFFGS